MNIKNLKHELIYYLEELEDLERSKTTIKNYNTNINMFINFVIVSGFEDITNNNINDILKKYRSHLKNKQNNQPSTRVRYLQEIIVFLEKLDYKIDIKLPKNTSKNKKIKYLTMGEIQTVMNSIPNRMVRDKSIFQTLYRTGLRVSELSNLTKNDLDLNSTDNAVAINVTAGKGEKDRTVYIDQDTLKLINTMIYKRTRKGRADKTDYLFTTLNGKSQLKARNIQHIIKKYAKIADEKNNKNGIKTNYENKLTPHTLRHSYTIYLINQAERPKNEVQKLLGHSNLATTSIYADVGNREVKKGYENIEWINQ